MTLDDVRPAIDGRPIADYSLRLVPDYAGYAPAALPPEWKRSLSAPAGVTS